MSKKAAPKRLYSRRMTSVVRAKKGDNLTLKEMFDRFMLDKETEGLTRKTIEDYYIHFKYLVNYLESDLNSEDITLDVFRGYVGYMLHEKGLSPVTANVRIRTMRAFLKFCFMEGWIEEAIHERFKPIKTSEDTLESFTPDEVKKLLNSIDSSTYRGFRDLVIVYVLLDTMVRCSELIQIKRKNVDIKTGSIQLEPHETKTKTNKISAPFIENNKAAKRVHRFNF